MKILLDTNVLFSGLGFSGVCGDLLREILKQRHTLVSTDYILEELREKVRRKFKEPHRERALDLLLFLLQRLSLEVKRFEEYQMNLDRAKGLVPEQDTPILAAAMLEEIDYFVTGDKSHFLENERVCSILGTRLQSPNGMLSLLLEER